MKQNAEDYFRTERTRGSPRSDLFRNFSCLLLTASFSLPPSLAAELALDRPSTIGPMKLVHSLYPAYKGIW
jgi:hypothetical protein